MILHQLDCFFGREAGILADNGTFRLLAAVRDLPSLFRSPKTAVSLFSRGGWGFILSLYSHCDLTRGIGVRLENGKLASKHPRQYPQENPR